MADKPRQTSNVVLQVAAAMHQMGIQGLPRNYELVYEAFSGANPELMSEFLALGSSRTQAMLDELGKKYFPHHQENSVAAQATTTLRAEVSHFRQLVEDERLSLVEFEQAIGHSAEILADPRTKPEAMRERLEAVVRATAVKAAASQRTAAAVAERSARIGRIAETLDEHRTRRNRDPLTGLFHRRVLDKELARIYRMKDNPEACGLAIVDIDKLGDINDRFGVTAGDLFIKDTGERLRRAMTVPHVTARLMGGRFTAILQSNDLGKICNIVERTRIDVSKARLRDKQANTDIGEVTISIGVCMSRRAASANELMQKASEALAVAKQSGGNRLEVYGVHPSELQGADLLLYQSGSS